MDIESKLQEIGLSLPPGMSHPPGLTTPFAWVRLRGDRAYVSGHGALADDGSPAGPFGRVPDQVSLEQAQDSAKRAGLAVLSSLRLALGDLDRIAAWLTVSGFINAVNGYERTTAVLNPLTELIVSLFGSEAGDHARTAIGVAALPLNLPVVISAEIEIAT